jgi:hypothetical protein
MECDNCKGNLITEYVVGVGVFTLCEKCRIRKIYDPFGLKFREEMSKYCLVNNKLK